MNYERVTFYLIVRGVIFCFEAFLLKNAFIY